MRNVFRNAVCMDVMFVGAEATETLAMRYKPEDRGFETR
jgi:hypothetical protein